MIPSTVSHFRANLGAQSSNLDSPTVLAKLADQIQKESPGPSNSIKVKLVTVALGDLEPCVLIDRFLSPLGDDPVIPQDNARVSPL